MKITTKKPVVDRPVLTEVVAPEVNEKLDIAVRAFCNRFADECGSSMRSLGECWLRIDDETLEEALSAWEKTIEHYSRDLFTALINSNGLDDVLDVISDPLAYYGLEYMVMAQVAWGFYHENPPVSEEMTEFNRKMTDIQMDEDGWPR